MRVVGALCVCTIILGVLFKTGKERLSQTVTKGTQQATQQSGVSQSVCLARFGVVLVVLPSFRLFTPVVIAVLLCSGLLWLHPGKRIRPTKTNTKREANNAKTTNSNTPHNSTCLTCMVIHPHPSLFFILPPPFLPSFSFVRLSALC